MFNFKLAVLLTYTIVQAGCGGRCAEQVVGITRSGSEASFPRISRSGSESNLPLDHP